MNSKQRRKNRRAYPNRYWTQAEIDAAKARALKLQRLLADIRPETFTIERVSDWDALKP